MNFQRRNQCLWHEVFECSSHLFPITPLDRTDFPRLGARTCLVHFPYGCHDDEFNAALYGDFLFFFFQLTVVASSAPLAIYHTRRLSMCADQFFLINCAVLFCHSFACCSLFPPPGVCDVGRRRGRVSNITRDERASYLRHAFGLWRVLATVVVHLQVRRGPGSLCRRGSE